MTNSCYNEITLTGDLKEVSRKFQDLKENKELLFMKYLIGMPDEIEEESEDDIQEKYGSNCDFPFSEVALHQMNENQIHFSCFSAKTPISAFLETLCEVCTINAQMFYAEPNYDYAGVCQIIDGEFSASRYNSFEEGFYVHKNEDFWDLVIAMVIEGAFEDEDDLESNYSFLTDADFKRLKSTIEVTKKYLKRA